ncbi:MAG: pyridoxal phosphate-dependent aminotransferase, partial [Gammaproteobacteria bacterium]
KYTAVDGTPSLKKAIINKLSRDNGLAYKPEQILVSSGGKQSFFNMALALLDKGDEVIIPAPYWVSYPDMVIIADATPVIVQTTDASRFKITATQLEQAITPKTRLLVLNSPSNPTGVAYTRKDLEALGAVLRKHPHVLIATDDMYEKIWWANEPFSNILNACPDLYERTIVLNGVSKAYAMTGWRIGYAAGPAKLIKAMNKVQSQSTSNPASISQYAAEAALNGDQGCLVPMVKAFKERHDYVIAELNSMPGVSCVPADGAFYAFANFQGVIGKKAGIGNDIELCEYLLNEVGVALVPGSAFGSEGYARISIATSLDTLKDAMGRIRKALAK